MTDVAGVLALCSALLLIVSVAIWAKVLRGPLMQRLDGGRQSNDEPAEAAAQILVFAFVTSALAAILAIVGWIYR